MESGTTDTMRAATRSRYGGPEVLSIAQLPRPVPRAGELLVRVRATTVNRTDEAILTAQPFFMRFVTGLRPPRGSGTDFAGDVAAVGDGVTAFAPGDRVMGFNDNGLGTHADYIVIPAAAGVVAIPEGIGYDHAAASCEGAHYAYTMVRKAPVTAGERVLVNGATGAIGSAAVQFLRDAGAVVTATCAATHSATVLRLGASRVIDYTTHDFTAEPGAAYTAVYDAVAFSSFGRCRHLLPPGGRYVAANLSGFLWSLPSPLLERKAVFPFPTNIRRSLEFTSERLADGRFVPLIDRAYPLEAVADAYRHVMSGHKLGNVILTFD